MITGQKGDHDGSSRRGSRSSMSSASMKPLTKMTRQIVSRGIDPDGGTRGIPGCRGGAAWPVHLELPEDIAAEDAESRSCRRIRSRSRSRNPKRSSARLR